MTDRVSVFEHHRPQLVRAATRILQSRADAEDVVQDAWLRWHRTDPAEINSHRAFLNTMITRLALDRLRRRASRREVSLEQWALPSGSEGDPAVGVELLEAVASALAVLLQQMSPLERSALVLHDVFQWSYGDVSRRLGRSEPAVRQLVHRARGRVPDPLGTTRPASHHAIAVRFRWACRTSDVEPLLTALAPELAAPATRTGPRDAKADASPTLVDASTRASDSGIGVQGHPR